VLRVETLVVDVIISELTKMSFAIIELGDCRLRDGRSSTCKSQKTHVLSRKTVETAAHFLTRVVARKDPLRQKCQIISTDILGGRSSSRAKHLRFRHLQKTGGRSPPWRRACSRSTTSARFVSFAVRGDHRDRRRTRCRGCDSLRSWFTSCGVRCARDCGARVAAEH